MDIFGVPTLGQDEKSVANTVLVNVILHTHEQWELWMQQVKQRAADANIWTTINPVREYPPEFIQKPTIPGTQTLNKVLQDSRSSTGKRKTISEVSKKAIESKTPNG